MKNIAIIGSGSWGTALAIHLAKMGNNIKMWAYLQEEADLINDTRKCKFLPQAYIPSNIICTTDLEKAIDGSEMILIVTPSKAVRETIKKFKKYVTNQEIIICSKGFEKETLYTLNEVVEEELPNSKIGGLSGPSHAEEVSMGIPTALVIASKHEDLLKAVQKTFMNEVLRIYTSDDVKGAELGGALKNILAFCAGIVIGQKLGDNTFAALITRGLSELSRLGVELGGQKETLYGLSGLGDLIVTCLSEHSRNRKAGKLIGQGKNLEETKKEVGMTIESIDNILVAHELGKIHGIEMPIVEAVYGIVYENLEPKQAVSMLMNRARKNED